MNTIVKQFDAVALQRKTRDEIDALIEGKSYEERKKQLSIAVLKLRDRVKKLKAKQ